MMKINLSFKLKAITLIELLVAMVILGILTGFASMYYADLKEDAIVAKVKTDIKELKKAMANYMSDEYNTNNLRPQKLSELVDTKFNAYLIKDSYGKVLKRIPINTDIEKIISTEYSNCTYEIGTVNRFFIEKLPSCPWGDAYYADLYYVNAVNPKTNQIIREPYVNPSIDRFYNGKPSTDFYYIEALNGGTVFGREGKLTLSSLDSSNNTPGSAVLLATKIPVGIIPLVDKKVIFEVTFKYQQKTNDSPILNKSGSRILETASGETYIPCAVGMIFFFKDKPKANAESVVMTSSGFGLKFSALDWELYESPTGVGLKKVCAGGWEENALHSVKFVFNSQTNIDCFIDGEKRANISYLLNSPASKLYFVISADYFTTLKVPPPPYPPIPVLADCELTINYLLISSVDFSRYYNVKIPLK